MDLTVYSKKALEVKLYGGDKISPLFSNLIHLCLGLGGECGELFEKIKKQIRDKQCQLSEKDKILISKELGDIIWYWTAICDELKLDPNFILKQNLEKIEDRLKREVLKGEGDER